METTFAKALARLFGSVERLATSLDSMSQLAEAQVMDGQSGMAPTPRAKKRRKPAFAEMNGAADVIG
mgnify:FL=1